jgi:negative regulator of flagellin synthesis FlgM
MKVTNNAPPNANGIDSAKAAEKTGADKAKIRVNSEAQVSASYAPVDSSVEISDRAKLLQKASEVVRNTADLRMDRVAALKKSIADGSYRVDSGVLADRILDEHLANNFGKNTL